MILQDTCGISLTMSQPSWYATLEESERGVGCQSASTGNKDFYALIVGTATSPEMKITRDSCSYCSSDGGAHKDCVQQVCCNIIWIT